MAQDNIPIDINSGKAAISKYFKDPSNIAHKELQRIYTKQIDVKKESKIDPKQLNQLIRFRSTHHPKIKYWKHKIGKEKDDKCRFCKESPETTIHLFAECPSFYEQRTKIFGTHTVDPDKMVKLPEKAAAFVGFILRRL